MSLTLVQKAFLLIAIPVCVELFLLYLLTVTMAQAQKDTRALANSGTALIYVNLILYDAVSSAENLMLSRAFGDPELLNRFQQTVVSLERHRDEFRKFAADNDSKQKELAAFDSVVGDFSQMFFFAEEIFSNEGVASQTRIVGKMRSYVTRLRNAGDQIINKQVKERQELMRKRDEDARQLQTLVMACAGLSVVVSLLLALFLGITFRRRIQNVVLNTQLIAINKPLPAVLSGKDELAMLDQGIHALANELAIRRRQERALLDNTGEIILSLDEQLRIQQINPAVARILGNAADDMLGAAVQSFVHEEDRTATYEALMACKQNEPDTSFESRMSRSDGQFIYALWNVHWSPDDRKYFCVIHDFTRNKQAELLREEVLAMVSHDLRSPLSNVLITLEILGSGALGTMSDKASDLVHNAERSVESLILMINDLLEVKRLEFGGFAFDLAQTKLQDIVDRAVSMLAKECERKSLTVVTDCGSHAATIDVERILRVLLNLLGNAIKFSPPGSDIQIKAESLTRDGKGWVQVKVIDHGPGIPPDKMKVVFEKFKQAGVGGEGEKVGTGLGLAICRAIVEAHGGEIGVDSEPGHGSTFWFRVPAQP
jgi:PAS domain S-box-containing protein